MEGKVHSVETKKRAGKPTMSGHVPLMPAHLAEGGYQGGKKKVQGRKKPKSRGAILKRGHKDTHKKEWKFTVNVHTSDNPSFLASGSDLDVHLYLIFLHSAFKGLFTVVIFDRDLQNIHIIYLSPQMRTNILFHFTILFEYHYIPSSLYFSF